MGGFLGKFLSKLPYLPPTTHSAIQHQSSCRDRCCRQHSFLSNCYASPSLFSSVISLISLYFHYATHEPPWARSIHGHQQLMTLLRSSMATTRLTTLIIG
ncbi:hypothetical protein BT93_D0838 [Corymbia citriodora subsp. variegata]|nr:hypothetical protein BT93_D0838 [Corymbia citriodora subsp. variegata]